MAWARIDDMLPMHPKVRALSDAAFRLYICAICWSSLHLSDGYIPSRHLRFMSDVRQPQRCADQLVEAGLWERAVDGWRIHDYLEYQPSADKVRKDREAKQQRQERWRTRRGALRDASQDASEDESPDASSRAGAPIPSHPIPSPSGSVVDHPADRNGHAPDLILIEAAKKAIYERTGKEITDAQAMTAAANILGSESVRNPAAYITAAINRDANPARFLPTPGPPRYQAPTRRPLPDEAVRAHADAIREVISREPP